MLVLGIETTCDETACSIVLNGKEILSNVIATQIDLHALYGGVFPELACRRHLEVFIPVIEKALKEAGVTLDQIDLIAAARGPGLIGAILIGLNAAKTLSITLNKPFIGVNHVEAHLYAAMMNCPNPLFPALGVVISGGHTFLVKILSLGNYELIGKTVDDAIGECFDKVGIMLGLSYPGGPAIEALAKKGDCKKYHFKKGVVKNNPWNFSFSGLKTNVLYTLKGQNKGKDEPDCISEEEKADIAASFQEVALGDIVDKSIKAAEKFSCQAIFLGGGVSANQRLRALFREKTTSIPLYFPPPLLSLDNAAMIAGLGYHLFIKKQTSDPLSLEPLTRIPLE